MLSLVHNAVCRDNMVTQVTLQKRPLNVLSFFLKTVQTTYVHKLVYSSLPAPSLPFNVVRYVFILGHEESWKLFLLYYLQNELQNVDDRLRLELLPVMDIFGEQLGQENSLKFLR